MPAPCLSTYLLSTYVIFTPFAAFEMFILEITSFARLAPYGGGGGGGVRLQPTRPELSATPLQGISSNDDCDEEGEGGR